MAWVYLSIAIGAAGFLVWIVIDYFNAASSLRPKTELARQEIRQYQLRIESERTASEAARLEVETLQKEIADLEKMLKESIRKVEEFQQRERRRKPTKFRLEG